jgi:predicted RNA-binding protein associated with RNAse of E/G family
MNRQLSALTDDEWAAMDFDNLAPDMPTQEPTPEQFQAALARLATMRQTRIDGGWEFTDLYVDLCEGTVSLVSESDYIVLSPAMLQAAAEWVAQQ